MSDLAQAFERSRRRIVGLAYRMLGDMEDARDIAQETFLRASAPGGAEIRSPEAYFISIATNLCIQRRKDQRRTRERYVGQWLPEPVGGGDDLSPEGCTELVDDLSFALLMTLERLSPEERAAFILHDVFDVSFAEIAETLGKPETACRQLASRARKLVRAERPGRRVSASAHQRLLAQFAKAVGDNDIEGLKTLLAADVVAYADGGGVKTAALNPVEGADKVARLLVGLEKKSRPGLETKAFDGYEKQSRGPSREARLATINGEPGFLLYLNGILDQTVTIATDGWKIHAVYMVRNPAKLRSLDGDRP